MSARYEFFDVDNVVAELRVGQELLDLTLSEGDVEAGVVALIVGNTNDCIGVLYGQPTLMVAALRYWANLIEGS